MANLNEDNDNPHKIANGELSLSRTATLRTDTINLNVPASGTFTPSSPVTLEMGQRPIDFHLTATFADSFFTLVPAGTYTYTIGLTISAP